MNNSKVEIHEQSLAIFQSRLYKHVVQKYYIINSIFLLLYPILRITGLILKPNNEIMIIYVSFFMVFLKILKNKNLDKILTSVLFTLKMSTIILLYYAGESKFILDNKKPDEDTFKFDNQNEKEGSNDGGGIINELLSKSIKPTSVKELGFYSNLFHVGFYYVLVYIVACAILYIYKSQPDAKESNNMQFYNQLTLKNALSHSSTSKELKDKYLLVEFFTTWSPPCTYLASTFADLSYIYNGINFGKIDIGRWKNIAFEYDINDSVSSKQIPTIILFKNGIEQSRLPYRKDEFQLPYDKKISSSDQKLFIPTNFLYDDIKNYFNLDKLLESIKPPTINKLTKINTSSNNNNNSSSSGGKNSKKNK